MGGERRVGEGEENITRLFLFNFSYTFMWKRGPKAIRHIFLASKNVSFLLFRSSGSWSRVSLIATDIQRIPDITQTSLNGTGSSTRADLLSIEPFTASLHPERERDVEEKRAKEERGRGGRERGRGKEKEKQMERWKECLQNHLRALPPRDYYYCMFSL